MLYNWCISHILLVHRLIEYFVLEGLSQNNQVQPPYNHEGASYFSPPGFTVFTFFPQSIGKIWVPKLHKILSFYFYKIISFTSSVDNILYFYTLFV